MVETPEGLRLATWTPETSEALRVGLRAMCKHMERSQYAGLAREIWNHLNHVDAQAAGDHAKV